MKRVFFIGNRLPVFQVLLSRKSKYHFEQLWVPENSILHRHLPHFDVPYFQFAENENSKAALEKALLAGGYDMVISNGCPFILPVEKIKSTFPDALLINTHPTYLPELKGKTPLNGVLYLDYDFIGATTHFMNAHADEGDIIYQEKVDITPDIDQGLIYFMSFKLEGTVFSSALDLLESGNFMITGNPQQGRGTYFNRRSPLFLPDFNQDSDADIVKKIRSVGINTQGVTIEIHGQRWRLFEADIIYNSWILDNFRNHQPGDLLLEYSNKILVKTREGIVRFSVEKDNL
ncbi:formyltransferase family protein [Pollutibacter soli]|uniref:formyltransferase family protein n=1 Tax=Pollutibacter soli TaxID=3034157 RepID=UPI0030138451